eukprot:10044615-Karenia_brevis.AAC.1
MALQETHIPTTHQEIRKHHAWYFSGKVHTEDTDKNHDKDKNKDKAIHEGVAIVVHNSLRNYIAD